MKSKASAVWQGELKDGQGHLSSTSHVLSNAPYTFKSRFEGANETSPEELIAAAHAGCFSMAMAMILGEANLVATEIKTEATVTLEKQDDGFAITKVHLDVAAIIPGATPDDFANAAGKAKAGCPVSKVLNAEITMDARLHDAG